MRVDLIEYTGSGHADKYHAADLMIFTKNTRVEMSPGMLEEIRAWPRDKKREELAYMANTIPSSWEFVDYIFMLSGVTRSFTHQLVRTRTASYAQQTMQILDMSAGWEWYQGPTIREDNRRSAIAGAAMAHVAEAYRKLVDDGAKIEDARELLPNGILTNIVVKANLRTLIDIFHTRISPRNLGMFRDVAVGMRDAILEVHPWAEVFVARTVDRAMEDLDAMIRAEVDDEAARTHMLKLVDQMRRKV